MTENSPDGAEAVVKLRSPADVLAAVPYLIGFHPEDSVVLIGLAESRLRVIFSMRADLPEVGHADEGAELAEYMTGTLVRQHPGCALLVGYGSGPRVTPMIELLHAALTVRDITLRESLRAEEGLYWSYLCQSAGCCPAEGTAYDVTTSEVAASATLAGCVALPHRADLAASIEPVVGLARESMRQATERAERRAAELGDNRRAAGGHPFVDEGVTRVAQAIDRAVAGERLDDDETAWLGVLLTHLRVRDEAWVRIDALDDGGYRQAHRTLWSRLVRRLAPRYIAAPACLLAFTAWRDGDGAVANIALERAYGVDPDYSMTRLLDQVLRTGTPPSSWRRLTADDLRTDACAENGRFAQNERRRRIRTD